MVLLWAIAAGLLAGLIRAWLNGNSLQAPQFNLVWLVPLAYLPQWLAFQFPATRSQIPVHLVALSLVCSQLLLLVFVLANRRQPGGWLLILGLALNLAVIGLNGGLMPISPDTVARLAPHAPPGAWEVGQRLGTTKDIVLPIANTRLWWLSDRFLFPEWIPLRVAFSLGDVFIAAGAFWMLWSLGGFSNHQTTLRIERARS